MPKEVIVVRAPVFTGRGRGCPDSSRELMARVAGGGPAAFSEFYDAMAPRAYGLIRRVVRDPAISEEVTQDVMIELWRTAARFDPARGSIVDWTLMVAHRRAIDRVRAEQAARRRDHRYVVRSASIDFDQTCEEATAAVDGLLVRGCLTELTELQRQTVLLAFYDGFTFPEVAEILSVTLPAVKARMRDALKRLRASLEEASQLAEPA